MAIDAAQKAKDLVAQMTLEEKASLRSGKNFLGLNASVPATRFPTAAATACSFDPSLMHRMGVALGKECRAEQVGIILGPTANIKRSPLCGRNFEYFSEDPLLTGAIAAGLIAGIQSQNVGTSMKHYLANNQE